jgi:hypothetical protein
MERVGIRKIICWIFVGMFFVLTSTLADAQGINKEEQEKIVRRASTEMIKIQFKLEKAKEEAMKGNYRKALSLVDDTEMNFKKIEDMIRNYGDDSSRKNEALEEFARAKTLIIDSFRTAIKELMKE